MARFDLHRVYADMQHLDYENLDIGTSGELIILSTNQHRNMLARFIAGAADADKSILRDLVRAMVAAADIVRDIMTNTAEGSELAVPSLPAPYTPDDFEGLARADVWKLLMWYGPKAYYRHARQPYVAPVRRDLDALVNHVRNAHNDDVHRLWCSLVEIHTQSIDAVKQHLTYLAQVRAVEVRPVDTTAEVDEAISYALALRPFLPHVAGDIMVVDDDTWTWSGFDQSWQQQIGYELPARLEAAFGLSPSPVPRYYRKVVQATHNAND